MTKIIHPAVKGAGPVLAWTIALVLLFCPGRACLADPPSASFLTLAWAKQIALENSPTLAAARERVVQAMETLTQARAEYLPTVSLGTSWDYAEATGNSSSYTGENSYTSQVSATQVLFRGFYRKYNNLAAAYGEQMNRSARDDAARTLAWSVARSYLNVQLARENIRIARSDMAFNRQEETEAVAKEKLGTGSYSDILNFRTKVNTAEALLVDAEQDYEEAVFGLAALMGYPDARLPDGMVVSPLDPVSDLDPEPALSMDLDTALDQRPDLAEDRLAVLEADARISREKSAFFPTVSLTTAYGVNGGDGFSDLGDSDGFGTAVGLDISFTLFSGGADRSAVRQAAAEKRELEQEQAEARIAATSEIRTALDKVEKARRQLSLRSENARLVETTRDLVKKEYDAGQASLVRLNEAQNDLTSARGSLADARVSLALALEELAYYTGSNVTDAEGE